MHRYCASGSTQGPPIVAICLRAGWKLGGVLNQYLTLENAGDQFVGRVASLLPLFTKEFGVLPPRFPDDLYKDIPEETGSDNDEMRQLREDRDLIEKAFVGMFGNPYMFGDDFAAVLRVCLASLCFHKDWIQNELPGTHPMKKSWLSNNPAKWARLKELVGPLKYDGDDGLRSHIRQFTPIRPSTNSNPSAMHTSERRACLRTRNCLEKSCG